MQRPSASLFVCLLLAATTAQSAWSQAPARLGAGITEDLRIGSVDGDLKTQFSRITTIRQHPRTNELFVANQSTYSIRVFSADARFVREFGRQGSGPGEFQAISGIVFAGDTVLVNDTRLLRVSAFRTSGELITSWPSVAPDRIQRRYFVSAAPAGWILVESAPPPDVWQPGTNIAAPAVYLHVSVPRAGEALPTLAADTMAIVPGRETIAIASPMATTAGAAPFAPSPATGVDASGRLYVHHGLPYMITVYGPKRAVIRRITQQHAPRPVTRAMIGQIERQVRAYHDTVSRRSGEYPIARAADFGRLELRPPGSLPPLGRMLVAPDGAVWVERLDLAADPVAYEWGRSWRGPSRASPTHWDRFDAAGRPLQPVELPARFSPMAVTANTALGVQRDEDGVEFVVRLTVR